MTRDHLVAALNLLATTLSGRAQALALLALGSCGKDLHRLDAYSDLDFFVIVEESAKGEFIADLSWLDTGCPLVFAHKNTPDGWKALSQNGVFCEFAVFHPAELATIPFADGRVVWAREGFDTSVLVPSNKGHKVDPDWLQAEALTNILIGLKRALRGEKLAAWRAIAVDGADLTCRFLCANSPQHDQADPFNPWRRLEVTNPAHAKALTAALAHKALPEMTRALMVLLGSTLPAHAPLRDAIHAHLEQCDALG